MYEPQEDSYLLADQVKIHAVGKVLDMGTGKGIQAETALEKGCEVSAVDVDPEAVAYCKKHFPKIRCIQSDLFENIDETFDTIIFNPPYLPQDKGIEDVALYGGEKGWEVVGSFISEAQKYLNENGIILLLFSSLTNQKKVEEFLASRMFEWEEVAKTHQFFEDLFVYKIKKTEIKKNLERKRVKNIRLLAKGKRGIVYEGNHQDRKVVIKISNPKSAAYNRIENEAEWLKRVNKEGIGPKLIETGLDYVIMEKVEGILIKGYLEKSSKEDIIQTLKSVIEQCYTLDQMKMSKKEMHNPYKHIIVGENPVLIDFERARSTERPQNVTQFCQYICKEEILKKLRSKGLIINEKKLTALAQKYRNEGDVQKILEYIQA